MTGAKSYEGGAGLQDQPKPAATLNVPSAMTPSRESGPSPVSASGRRMTPDNLKRLQADHVRLGAWLNANALEKAGTPEYAKATKAHQLVTDLVARGGGNAEERSYVDQKLAALLRP